MKCPGQDTRYWGPEAVYETTCPKCGGQIEFFKDESSRKCRKCGEKVLNTKMNFGCAVYCKFAAQCLGMDMPPELLAKRNDLLKDRAATEVKKFLGRNFRRIGRMLKVIDYSEKIQKAEGGDPAIITLAACLSAIAGVSLETQGEGAAFSAEDAAAAKSILSRAATPDEVAYRVLSILSNAEGPERKDDWANFKCVRDAIRIAEAVEAVKSGKTAETAGSASTKELYTETGRKLMAAVSSEQ
ncbi:MAG: hypothetical protein P4L55_19160 [Syntrophobacteraceae bacterium]|nr:hypothetical protein [Syntrophobacteraceae bacterium]